MRVAFWVIFLVLLIVPGWSGDTRKDVLGPVARFTFAPVSIRADSPNRRVGALTFLRGYRLTSPDPAFGGFSSLMVEGERFTLLSDGGDIFSFRLDGRGKVSGARFAELPAGPGTGWTKFDRDSESMTRDPATGRIWVGFENWNAIWRYTPDFRRGEANSRPRAMLRWPHNGGPEAMVRLRNGTFLVLAEEARGPGKRGRVGLVFAGDPTTDTRPPVSFVYLPPEDFVPSDATELPDGRIILLNRRFEVPDGFEVAVTVIDPRLIRAGAEIRGTEIARFAGDVLHDNYEGIAVGQENGRPVLWIVSDDNQSIFQQSLLLEFTLPGVATQTAPPGRQGR